MKNIFYVQRLKKKKQRYKAAFMPNLLINRKIGGRQDQRFGPTLDRLSSSRVTSFLPFSSSRGDTNYPKCPGVVFTDLPVPLPIPGDLSREFSPPIQNQFIDSIPG